MQLARLPVFKELQWCGGRLTRTSSSRFSAGRASRPGTCTHVVLRQPARPSKPRLRSAHGDGGMGWLERAPCLFSSTTRGRGLLKARFPAAATAATPPAAPQHHANCLYRQTWACQNCRAIRKLAKDFREVVMLGKWRNAGFQHVAQGQHHQNVYVLTHATACRPPSYCQRTARRIQ